jgi:hypothetical protein
LDECPFFDFAMQNQKMGIHPLFYFAAEGGECLLRQAQLKIPSEAVPKDPWQLTPPKNILNEWLFF